MQVRAAVRMKVILGRQARRPSEAGSTTPLLAEDSTLPADAAASARRSSTALPGTGQHSAFGGNSGGHLETGRGGGSVQEGHASRWSFVDDASALYQLMTASYLNLLLVGASCVTCLVPCVHELVSHATLASVTAVAAVCASGNRCRRAAVESYNHLCLGKHCK